MKPIQRVRRYPTVHVARGCYREPDLPVVWTRDINGYWEAYLVPADVPVVPAAFTTCLHTGWGKRLDATRLNFLRTLGWSIERMARTTFP